MQNIFLYIENQNKYKINESNFRIDTPYQKVSNNVYQKLKIELFKLGYNFDFLGGTHITENDIIIISNIQSLNRSFVLKLYISLKSSLRSFLFGEDKIKIKFPICWKIMAARGKLVPFLWESETLQSCNWDKNNHKYFKRILTWNSDLIDNETYFKCLMQAGPLLVEENEVSEHSAFNERELFLTSVNHNKISFGNGSLYEYRYKLFDWLGQHYQNMFKLYGGGWDKKPEYVGEYPYSVSNLLLYNLFLRKYNNMDGIKKIILGNVEDKNIILENSKFSLCIENNGNSRGYLTEKFFDVIKAGSIPVYLGAIDITDLVPNNIFINIRDFNNRKDLLEFLIHMDVKKGLEYQINGYEFLLNSNQIQEYLPKNIAMQIVKAIND